MTTLRIEAERPTANGWADSALVPAATAKMARGEALTVPEWMTLVAANAWATDQLSRPPNAEQVFPHAYDRATNTVLVGDAGQTFVGGDLSLPVAPAPAPATPAGATDTTAATHGVWRRSGVIAPPPGGVIVSDTVTERERREAWLLARACAVGLGKVTLVSAPATTTATHGAWHRTGNPALLLLLPLVEHIAIAGIITGGIVAVVDHYTSEQAQTQREAMRIQMDAHTATVNAQLHAAVQAHAARMEAIATGGHFIPEGSLEHPTLPTAPRITDDARSTAQNWLDELAKGASKALTYGVLGLVAIVGLSVAIDRAMTVWERQSMRREIRKAVAA